MRSPQALSAYIGPVGTFRHSQSQWHKSKSHQSQGPTEFDSYILPNHRLSYGQTGVLTLLAKLEALARAVLCTVGINLHGILTDSNRPGTGPAGETSIITRHAATRLVLGLAVAAVAVAPIKAFIVIIISTMIPD